jgi:hypothetical protein
MRNRRGSEAPRRKLFAGTPRHRGLARRSARRSSYPFDRSLGDQGPVHNLSDAALVQVCQNGSVTKDAHLTSGQRLPRHASFIPKRARWMRLIKGRSIAELRRRTYSRSMSIRKTVAHRINERARSKRSERPNFGSSGRSPKQPD